MQICDEPTILLIDTPGIMLPKLKESLFAYRVALAGLVQETQVSLQELFAFTLYALSQHPNRGQLKVVLSQPLPPDDKPGRFDDRVPSSAHMRRSPQGAVRHAYASKRLAKCILQGIDEAVEGMISASTETDPVREDTQTMTEQQDIWSHRQDESLVQARRSRAPRNRPHFAHEHLALMESDAEPIGYVDQASSCSADTSVDDPLTEGCGPTAEGRHAMSTPEAPRVLSPQSTGHSQRFSQRPWMPYNSEFWGVCGDAVLRRLLKVDSLGGSGKLQREQVTSAMERIIRMARSGDFGPLVFEHPSFKQQ